MAEASVWDFSGIYETMYGEDAFSSPRDALAGIPACYINMKELPGTSCYCDADAEKQISAVLKKHDSARIHLIDSGSYHYLSLFFLRLIREPFRLIVFDNHTDMQPPAFGGLLSCGGWVLEALETLPELVELWLIGPDEESIAAALAPSGDRVWHEKKLRFLSRESLEGWRRDGVLGLKTAEWVREGFAVPAQGVPLSVSLSGGVYLSVDKDVLSKTYAKTSWSQGDLTLDELTGMMGQVMASMKEAGLPAAGIDICGESETHDDAGCALSRQTNRRLMEFLKGWL